MADAFDNVLFPTDISYGFEGGPTFATLVVKMSSGAEQRFRQRAKALVAYDVVQGVKTRKMMDNLRAFYMARDGSARSFLFLDPMDHKAVLQPVQATGVANTYQLVKSYISGPTTRIRKINRIDTAAMREDRSNLDDFRLYSNGVVQNSGYALNTSTGILTTTIGGILTWSGWFYVRARFDGDVMSHGLDDFDVANWNNIRIVELLDA